MKLETWNIHGLADFHFGRHGIGQEASGVTFPSDSLFAALVSQMAMIKPADEVSNWCQAYQADPSFLLTTAFPMADNILFFPLPMNCQQYLAETSSDPKAYKDVAFISHDLLSKLIEGDYQQLHQATHLQGGAVLISQSELDRLDKTIATNHSLWKIGKRPRVTIDRENSGSNLYHTGVTTFQPNCGLWFGIKWRRETPEERKLLIELFTLLGDSGLGGERSAGCGAARITQGEVISFPDSGEGLSLLLSRYIPGPGEWFSIKHPQARYKVVEIGGWSYAPNQKAQRRKPTVMIEPGSILPRINHPLAGCIVDVRPTYEGAPGISHPLWRAGYALAVGMKGG